MPLRFNKEERDEWRSRMAGKSHTCEACCKGNCKDCSGTCDCKDCHKGGSNASVLDALESKTASGQCPMCGGPSVMLGQLGNRVHYRCRNCGADHSSEYEDEERGPYQDFEEELGHSLLGPHDHHARTAAPVGLEQGVAPAVEQGGPEWGGVMEQPRVEPQGVEFAATPGHCTNCGSAMPYAGPHGNQYCPNCHMEHDPHGRPLGEAPAPAAAGHAREGEPLSQYDEPARWAAKQAAPVFPNTHNQVAPQAPTQAQQEPAWGRVQACPQCGHGMHTYEGQRGAMCSNCGHEEAVMAQQPARTADASMPPEGVPYQQKETALPYNPAAYEGQVEDMHPAAQYTYQRAVAQGSDPQAAYQAAQEKQGEMGKRTQEGQNTEGVQIPVINTSYHGDSTGFVTAATIKRISHLL